MTRTLEPELPSPVVEPRSRRLAPRFMNGLRAASMGASAVLVSGCCLLVKAPSAQEFLATGYRTPEQTFHTFQVGWRAEEPDMERRCFSPGFLESHQISRLGYRVFREKLTSEQPFLRLGIADARLDGPARVDGRRARLTATSHGHTIELDLVLDDVVRAWSGETLVLEKTIDDWGRFMLLKAGDDGSRRLWGYVDLAPEVDAGKVSELRFAREWKIDDLRQIESPRTTSP